MIIDINSVDSIDRLLEILQALSSTLPQTDLANLTSFNYAYMVITHSYLLAIKSSWFDHPSEVEKLSIIFARYYLNMLNQYASGQSPPIVWQKAYQSSGNNQRPKYISLLIAANTHISHDLPLALRAAAINQAGKTDFFKADKLFKRSDKVIIQSFSESNTKLDFLKDKLRPLYARPLILIVLHYRHKAWRASFDKNTTEQDLTNSTLKIAKLFE